jgi:hypothetical protein
MRDPKPGTFRPRRDAAVESDAGRGGSGGGFVGDGDNNEWEKETNFPVRAAIRSFPKFVVVSVEKEPPQAERATRPGDRAHQNGRLFFGQPLRELAETKNLPEAWDLRESSTTSDYRLSTVTQ